MELNELLEPNINVVIEGRAIVLIPLTENEINEQYISWLNDPEVNEFLEVRSKEQTREDIYDYVNGLREIKGCEIFAILTKKERRHIGNIAITPGHTDAHEDALSFGVLMGDKNAQKFGLGAEASMLIIDFLFNYRKIMKIEEGAIDKNNKSWRMLEHFGFIREGVLRKHSLLPCGEVRDLFLYGMFPEEWKKNRAKVALFLKDMKVTCR